MAESTVYAVALGFFLGGALKDFFSAVCVDLVAPVLGVFSGAEKAGAAVVVNVGGVKLEVGKAVGAFLTLLISLLVAATVLPYVRAYAPKLSR